MRAIRRIVLCAGLLPLLAGVPGCGATIADSPTLTPTPEGLPRVICQGHADIDGGIALLRPARSAAVVEVCFREGDRVKAGDVLVRLDDSSARLEVTAAKARLRTAQAGLDSAEQDARQHPSRLKQQRSALTAMSARLAGARVTLKRQADLFDKSLVSKSEVDLAREQVRELEANVEAARERVSELAIVDTDLPARSAQAQIDAARARLAQAEHAVTQFQVLAPSAGTLLALRLHVGEIAAPAGPGVIEFCPEKSWIVRAEVEQEFAADLHPGQPVRVRDERSGFGPWNGQIDRISQAYERRRNALDPAGFKDVPTVECLIRLDPGHPPLRIGQRLRVSVHAGGGDRR